MRKYSTVVLEIPLNDELSPYSIDSEYPCLHESYEVAVISQDTKTVTICVSNQNNLSKGTVLQKKQLTKPKIVILPRNTTISDICDNNKKLNISNLGSSVVSSFFGDEHNLNKNLTVDDVVYSVSKFGNR